MYPDDLLNLVDRDLGLMAAKLKARGGLAQDAPIQVSGIFHVKHFDVDGTLLDEFDVHNAPVTVGLNYLLDGGFRNQSIITTWYCGLIDNAAFTAVAAADTMSSHTGWAELQAYSQGNRVTWSPATASAGVIQNSSAMTFTINADNSVRGIFITSDNTKGGTSGTLWSTAVEASGRAVTNGQTFQVVYQLTLTPVS